MARIEAETGKSQGGLMKWIDDRFPFTKTMEKHVTKYYASKNFNFWYGFGVLATVVLVAAHAFLLAQMMQPTMPEQIGAFRDVIHEP